jgi:hypothetical protein
VIRPASVESSVPLNVVPVIVGGCGEADGGAGGGDDGAGDPPPPPHAESASERDIKQESLILIAETEATFEFRHAAEHCYGQNYTAGRGAGTFIFVRVYISPAPHARCARD